MNFLCVIVKGTLLMLKPPTNSKTSYSLSSINQKQGASQRNYYGVITLETFQKPSKIE